MKWKSKTNFEHITLNKSLHYLGIILRFLNVNYRLENLMMSLKKVSWSINLNHRYRFSVLIIDCLSKSINCLNIEK